MAGRDKPPSAWTSLHVDESRGASQRRLQFVHIEWPLRRIVNQQCTHGTISVFSGRVVTSRQREECINRVSGVDSGDRADIDWVRALNPATRCTRLALGFFPALLRIRSTLKLMARAGKAHGGCACTCTGLDNATPCDSQERIELRGHPCASTPSLPTWPQSRPCLRRTRPPSSPRLPRHHRAPRTLRSTRWSSPRSDSA